MGLGLVAGQFIHNIKTFCDLGKYPVLGIDHFAVQVNDPTECSHLAAGFFKFRSYIPHAGRLPCSGFPVYENIRWRFIPEGRGQN